MSESVTRQGDSQEEQTAAGQASDFVREAEEKRSGFVREFYEFLRDNKKWWLIPIILVLLILGLLLLVPSVAAPFIYTLF